MTDRTSKASQAASQAKFDATKTKWETRSFGDCAVLVRDTIPPSQFGEEPYVGLEHIGEGTLQLIGIGTAQDVRTAKTRFRSGDILFGKLRPYFRKVIRPHFDGICSTSIWVVRPTEGVDAGFLFYLMASQEFVRTAMMGSEGTTMPAATWDHVSRIKVMLPPLPEQREISRILGTLDDKIELNRHQNGILEEMTRTLFKSWFVDFDPVRAKMEGHWRPGESLPGLPAHLYNHFPDRLVPSELGEIPKGWEVHPLAKCIEVKRGLSYKGANLSSSEGLPMHNLNSVQEGGGYKYQGIKYYTGDYQTKHQVKPRDILVANTEQGHDRLLIGYAAIVPTSYKFKSLFSHHLYRLRLKSNSSLTVDYVYHLVNSSLMHSIISNYATGTTVSMLPMSALQLPHIIVPPSQVILEYTNLSKKLLAQQTIIRTISQELEKSRNILVPRFLNSGIDIESLICSERSNQ